MKNAKLMIRLSCGDENNVLILLYVAGEHISQHILRICDINRVLIYKNHPNVSRETFG